MMPLVPAGYAYTESEVIDVLQFRYGIRTESFRYEVLTSTNVHKGWVERAVSGSAEYDSTTELKRSGKFTFVEGAGVDIDYLNDRIRPWMRLGMPGPQGSGRPGYVEYPLGVFLISSPDQTGEGTSMITREIEGFDQLLVCQQAGLTEPYYISSGYVITTALNELYAGIPGISVTVTPSAATLPTQMMWDTDKTRLNVANDLHAALGYEPLYFDNTGQGWARPAVKPNDAASSWTYADDARSIVLPEITRTADLFALPNVWTSIVSDPERGNLRAQWINDDPSSPTSTVSRGREIVAPVETSDAINQAVLNVEVENRAREDMAVYETYKFSTSLMPLHQHGEVYTLNRRDLGVNMIKLAETNWAMELIPGGSMQHTARRAIDVAGGLA